jgi:hypothetical protein
MLCCGASIFVAIYQRNVSATPIKKETWNDLAAEIFVYSNSFCIGGSGWAG